MKIKIKFPRGLGKQIISVILLSPAVVFWSSVVMVWGMGTDYFYDVIFAPMSQNLFGKLILLALLAGFPAFDIIINRKGLKSKKWGWQQWFLIISGILSVLGIGWIFLGVTI
jgi:hypothetical protein